MKISLATLIKIFDINCRYVHKDSEIEIQNHANLQSINGLSIMASRYPTVSLPLVAWKYIDAENFSYTLKCNLRN